MNNIPMEILEKYGIVDSLEERLARPTRMPEREIKEGYYRSFLNATDYIINKLVEGHIKTEDCIEELKYREFARQEIARLKGETPAVVENQKTLEQRIAEAEEKTELAVSYDELQEAIMEGVNEV